MAAWLLSHWSQRYAIALGAVAAALLLSTLAGPLIARTIFVLFWPAVIFTAWFCGFGPALITTLLGVISIDYFLVEPRHQLMPGGLTELAQLSVFVLASLVIAGLASQARLAQERRRDANQALDASTPRCSCSPKSWSRRWKRRRR